MSVTLGAQNSAQAQAVQEQLGKLGVDAKNIQTSNFSINPTYGNDGRQVTGYHVSNMVTVKVRQIGQAGTLLDQAVQAGAKTLALLVQREDARVFVPVEIG